MLTSKHNQKMKYKIPSIAAIAALSLANPTSASTLLFADNFNDPGGNEDAASFNNNLASTQSGSLVSGGPIDYAVNGSGWRAQHSNGGNLLVGSTDATFAFDFGSVSLNYNFATIANTLDQALIFSFNIVDVFGFGEPTNWIAFAIDDTQNQFITNSYGGLLFRQNGGTQLFGDGSAGPSWTDNDTVTITLSNTAGNGSAFNGNGSVAKIKIGANTESVFTLAQQSNAFITVNSIQAGQFGAGIIDNLTVTAVPEPSAALLGGLGALALLRRRRA